jgi:hypothetical protein
MREEPMTADALCKDCGRDAVTRRRGLPYCSVCVCAVDSENERQYSTGEGLNPLAYNPWPESNREE